MELVNVSAKTNEVKEDKDKGITAVPSKVVTVPIPFATSAKEAIEASGDPAILSNANANAIITVRASIKRGAEAGASVKELTEKFKNWKMGMSMRKTSDPMAVIDKKVDSLDEQGVAELIAKLQKKQQASKAA